MSSFRGRSKEIQSLLPRNAFQKVYSGIMTLGYCVISFVIYHTFFLYSDAPRESDDDVDQQQQSQQDNNLASGGSDETDSLFQAFSDDARDGIAEPIYHLISEVFELRGVFGWLRRTLVTFVQITYGRTINRYKCYLKCFLKLDAKFKCVSFC